MPSYAATLAPVLNQCTAPMPNPKCRPIPRMTRLLADFHTSLNIPALRFVDGNVDRLLVFCLLVRTALAQPDRGGAISIHSAALSLGRPFETVRRHVVALVRAGVCERTPRGVTLSMAAWEHPDAITHMQYTHDCFIRLVADGMELGGFTRPDVHPTRSFQLESGVCAAADLMLALVDGNRRYFSEAVDLAIFSAIIHANAQRFEDDAATCGNRPTSLLPRHAVRVAEVARMLSLPDTTVRRRIAPFTGPGRIYARHRTGLLVTPEQLPCDDIPHPGEPRHGSIRLILSRAAADGLCFAMPTGAYRIGRPPSQRIN